MAFSYKTRQKVKPIYTCDLPFPSRKDYKFKAIK